MDFPLRYDRIHNPRIKLGYVPKKSTSMVLTEIALLDLRKVTSSGENSFFSVLPNSGFPASRKSQIAFSYFCPTAVKKYQHWKFLFSHEMNPGARVEKGKKHKVGVSKTQFKNFSNELCAKLNVPNILGLGIRLTKAFGENIDFSEEIEISQSFTFIAPKRKTKTLWAIYQLIDTYYFYENLSVCFSHNGSPVSPKLTSNIGQFNWGNWDYRFKNPSYMYQGYPMLGTNIAVNKQILDQDFRVIGKSRFSDQVRKVVRQVHPTAKLVVPSMQTREVIDPP